MNSTAATLPKSTLTLAKNIIIVLAYLDALYQYISTDLVYYIP
jgi:hypothetical protein